jgi:hypothetical protein
MSSNRVVIGLHAADRSGLGSALDTVANMASRMSAADLPEFASLIAAEVATSAQLGPLRAAIVATDPDRLTARARRAAHLARTAALTPPLAGPGLFVSQEAGGRVILLLSGLADSPLAHAQVQAAADHALGWLAAHGVLPAACVGYGLGELSALAWAGSLPAQEVARLTALRAEVLRAAPRNTGVARVFADAGATGELARETGLSLAAQEGPRQHLLTGARTALMRLRSLAGSRGIRVGVLDTVTGLHAPELAALTPAMRGAMAGTVFRAPRRRVALASAGRELRPSDDIAELVARHVAEPAWLTRALAAAGAADLIVAPPGDHEVAAAVATCGAVPVIQAPDPFDERPGPAATAALFAAGAIRQVS